MKACFRRVSFLLVFSFLSGFIPAHSAPSDIDAIAASYAEGEYEKTRTLVFSSIEAASPLARPKLLLLLASAFLETGDPGQAKAILNGIKNLSPRFERTESFALLQARAEELTSGTDRSLVALKGFDSDRVLFKTALLLEGQNQSYAAILKFQELIRAHPQSPLAGPSQLGLARSYATLREWDQAKSRLNSAALPSELMAFQFYLLGSIAFQQGRFEEARQALKQIDDRAPPEMKSSAKLLDGLSALNAGDSAGEPILFSLLQNQDLSTAFQSAFELVKHNLKQSRPEKAVSVCNAVLPALVSDARKSDALLLRAISFEKAGQTDQAIKDFQEGIDLGGQETVPKALVLLAYTLWNDRQFDRLSSDFSGSLKSYRSFAKTNPARGNGPAVELEVCDLLIGQAQLSMRRYPEAEKVFNQLLSKALSPQLSYKAAGGLVAALVAQQKFGEAEKRLDELMVRYGEDRPVIRFGLLAKAHLLWNKREYKEAETSYRKYAEMFPGDEETPSASYMAGRCLEKSGRASEALKAWDQVRKQFPESPYAARALVRSATLADRTGDRALAQSYYQQMAGIGDSRMVELALLQIGLARLKNNQDEEAIKTLTRFSEQYPLSSYSSKAAQGLKDAYQQIASVDPAKLQPLAVKYATAAATGEAFYWIGMKEKDPAKAIPHFQKVITQYPRTPSFSRALFYKGQAELDLKDYKAALVSLGEFTKSSSDPDLTVIAQFQRAGALAKAGFPDEACLAYQRVIKESPYSTYAAQSYLQWSRVLHTKGDYDSEIIVYESFLKDFPQNPKGNEVYWHLGQLKRRAGAYQVAMAYYQKVVPADGIATKQEVDEAIRSLEKMVSKEGRP